MREEISLKEAVLADSLLNQVINFVFSSSRRVYLVGGCLRDLILSRPTLDIDLVIEGETLSFSSQLADFLNSSYYPLDEKRKMGRIVVRKNEVTRTIDLSPLYGQIEKNLMERDFTINALALDTSLFRKEVISIKEVIDPVGGLRDLKAGRIKVASKDSFKGDPVRLLRALRLAGELKFKLSSETLTSLKKEAILIKRVSVERVCEELLRLLALNNSSYWFQSLEELGFIKVIFPELVLLKGLTQNQFHHLDVWGHTLLTLAELDKILLNLKGHFKRVRKIKNHLKEPLHGDFPRLIFLKFSTLFHDIGKSLTKSIDEKRRIHFYEHPKVGLNLLKPILERLKLSNRAKKAILTTVKEHMRPGYLVEEKKITGKAISHFLKDGGKEVPEILILSLADRFAAKGPLSKKETITRHQKLVRALMEEYFEKRELKPLLITGQDLIDNFNLKPSPFIGKIMSIIEKAQLEKKLSSREEAISFVQNYLKRCKKIK